MSDDGNITGNVCICMDITRDDYSKSYADFNLAVIIIVMPVFAVFGFITNIFNVIVFTRPQLRSSVNAYLLALACSDFCLLLTAALLFWIDSARSYIPILKNSPYIVVWVLPMSYFAQTCSIYFTVFAAMDCFMSTCLRKWARKWCRLSQACLIICCTVLGSFIYNLPRFRQLYVRHCYADFDTPLVEFCMTDFFESIYLSYSVYMYLVVMTMLPFFLLLAMNIAIILTVCLIRPPSTTSSSSTTSDIITLVMVVILFLSCNLLGLVINIVESFFEPPVLLLNYLSDMSNLLVIFNSSVNFIIYFVCMREFRVTFLQLCCCRGGAQPINNNNSVDGYVLVTTSNGVKKTQL